MCQYFIVRYTGDGVTDVTAAAAACQPASQPAIAVVVYFNRWALCMAFLFVGSHYIIVSCMVRLSMPKCVCSKLVSCFPFYYSFWRYSYSFRHSFNSFVRRCTAVSFTSDLPNQPYTRANKMPNKALQSSENSGTMRLKEGY